MPELRIISLLSSATEIVHALGLGRFQVGRSHECDYPALVANAPVCSRPNIAVDGSSAEIDRLVQDRVSNALSVYDLDSELIGQLQPTHLITQTQCKVCAVSLDDVERALQRTTGTGACVVSLEPHAMADVWEDVRRVARACNVSESGERLIEDLVKRMRAIEERAGSAPYRPTVAAIEWLEPLMTGGNWIPELIALAGGRNLFGTAGQHSPYLDWTQLREADPDIVIAFPCGFDLPRTRAEMHWMEGRQGWSDLRAVRSGSVFLCDGNQFMNRPGPRLVESLQIFAEIIHPELFPSKLRGIGWEEAKNNPG